MYHFSLFYAATIYEVNKTTRKVSTALKQNFNVDIRKCQHMLNG